MDEEYQATNITLPRKVEADKKLKKAQIAVK